MLSSGKNSAGDVTQGGHAFLDQGRAHERSRQARMAAVCSG